MTSAVLTQNDVPAQEQPRRGMKGFARWAFNKAVDMGCRAAVTNSIKIFAATTLIGAGASSVLTIGVTAVASGVGAGLYAYLKDYALAKRKYALEGGDEVRFFDKARLKKVKWALLAGVAGGAFGSWLAGTETFQSGLAFVKDMGLKGLASLADAFSTAAQAAPPITTLAAPASMSVMPDTAVAAAAPAEVFDVERANPTALDRLWKAVMTSDQAKGKMMAEMLKANGGDMNSVSPQFLKDRAHDILRMKDIPLDERISIARDLATAAQERGNKQAVQFLKDLLEFQVKNTALEKVTVIAPKLPAVELPQAELPVVHIPEEMPVKTVLLDTDPATGEVTERIVDAIPAEKLTVERVAVRDFREAALCRVSAPDADGVYDAECDTFKDDMEPGDYVTFVAQDNPLSRDITPLTEDSVALRTSDFLHETVIADGVRKVSGKGVAVAMNYPMP